MTRILGELIRARRDDIIRAWESAHAEALRDELPCLLEGIAVTLEHGDDLEIARRHAIRLHERFDIATLVRELGRLREVTLRVTDDTREVRVAFDLAIAASVERHELRLRESLERALSRPRFLANVTTTLSQSLDYHETLDRLASTVVPELADWCIVDLVDEGDPKRVAIAHKDPAQVEAARRWVEQHPPDWNDPGGVPQVIRTGKPVMYPEVDEARLRELITDPVRRAATRALGIRSLIIVPIVGREHVLGAITLVTIESSRHYGTEDLALASELGNRVGIVVENVRLYRQSQEAVALRENILAMVSHDLRNPLGAIELGASALQTQLHGNTQADRTLGVIRRSVRRMEHLIGDLLDMARIRSGTFAIEPAADDAGTIVGETIDSCAASAAERGVALDVRCDLDGVTVTWDRDRIIQALGNVLGNAIKFCRQGDTVKVVGHHHDDLVELDIVDTGPGIAPENIKRLFEPYWSTKQNNRQGTGLGLHICRAIIAAHHGAVSATSELGSGSRFTFKIPLQA